MDNRYENISILKTENGKRYKKTIQYPIIDRHIDDIYIIGTPHDRLDNLAYKYYNDSQLWWIIARANNLGKGNLNVPTSVQVRIPANYLKILTDYRDLNK
tara:strand:- start:988 stop:1287 length:300 start_codon:yes stop_codon:yes gene_type:complete